MRPLGVVPRYSSKLEVGNPNGEKRKGLEKRGKKFISLVFLQVRKDFLLIKSEHLCKP